MNALLAPNVFGPLTKTGSNLLGSPPSSDRSPNLCDRESITVVVGPDYLQDREENIARLTEAAYRAVLELGYRGSFLDLELSLWNVIRQAVEQRAVDFVPKDGA
jgi:hypothetical protein